MPAASACSHASSISLFFRRLQIVNGHGATFALAERVARAAPATGQLIAVAMFTQHVANGSVGDVRQSALAQGSSQRRERPGRRLILLPIGHPLHLGQDACLLLAGVEPFAAATGGDEQGRQPMFVEALHQLAYPIPARRNPPLETVHRLILALLGPLYEKIYIPSG